MYLVAGVKQTLTRPVVLTYMRSTVGGRELSTPGGCVYAMTGTKEQREAYYAREAARLLYEHAGLLLCGDAIPAILLDVGPESSPLDGIATITCSVPLHLRRTLTCQCQTSSETHSQQSGQ